jgi:hypothetical protein
MILKTHQPLDMEVIDSGSKMLASEQSEHGSKVSAKAKKLLESQPKKGIKPVDKKKDYSGVLSG